MVIIPGWQWQCEKTSSDHHDTAIFPLPATHSIFILIMTFAISPALHYARLGTASTESLKKHNYYQKSSNKITNINWEIHDISRCWLLRAYSLFSFSSSYKFVDDLFVFMSCKIWTIAASKDSQHRKMTRGNISPILQTSSIHQRDHL